VKVGAVEAPHGRPRLSQALRASTIVSANAPIVRGVVDGCSEPLVGVIAASANRTPGEVRRPVGEVDLLDANAAPDGRIARRLRRRR
jgi:hypothetical protein